MACLDNERVKELIKINRMVYPTPPKDNIESTIAGNYLIGLTDLIDDFVKEDFKICEIGSYIGISSELFSLFCETLYCVDSWLVWEEMDMAEMPETHFDSMLVTRPNIVKIKKESTEASNDFDDYFFDMIYIDGDHSEDGFRKDIENWFSKVKDGGVIAGHDYHLVKDWLDTYIERDFVTTYLDGSWAYIK